MFYSTVMELFKFRIGGFSSKYNPLGSITFPAKQAMP